MFSNTSKLFCNRIFCFSDAFNNLENRTISINNTNKIKAMMQMNKIVIEDLENAYNS